jgi:predicted nucleic acid-binding protein
VSGYLLDTDAISLHLRGDPRVTAALQAAVGRLYASVVTLAELTAWMERRNTPRSMRAGFAALVPDIVWLPMTFEIARHGGELRAKSYDAGQPLPLIDLLIAATALEHGLAVVTHNVRHYQTVSGLAVEDWAIS